METQAILIDSLSQSAVTNANGTITGDTSGSTDTCGGGGMARLAPPPTVLSPAPSNTMSPPPPHLSDGESTPSSSSSLVPSSGPVVRCSVSAAELCPDASADVAKIGANSARLRFFNRDGRVIFELAHTSSTSPSTALSSHDISPSSPSTQVSAAVSLSADAVQKQCGPASQCAGRWVAAGSSTTSSGGGKTFWPPASPAQEFVAGASSLSQCWRLSSAETAESLVSVGDGCRSSLPLVRAALCPVSSGGCTVRRKCFQLTPCHHLARSLTTSLAHLSQRRPRINERMLRSLTHGGSIRAIVSADGSCGLSSAAITNGDVHVFVQRRACRRKTRRTCRVLVDIVARLARKPIAAVSVISPASAVATPGRPLRDSVTPRKRHKYSAAASTAVATSPSSMGAAVDNGQTRCRSPRKVSSRGTAKLPSTVSGSTAVSSGENSCSASSRLTAFSPAVTQSYRCNRYSIDTLLAPSSSERRASSASSADTVSAPASSAVSPGECSSAAAAAYLQMLYMCGGVVGDVRGSKFGWRAPIEPAAADRSGFSPQVSPAAVAAPSAVNSRVLRPVPRLASPSPAAAFHARCPPVTGKTLIRSDAEPWPPLAHSSSQMSAVSPVISCQDLPLNLSKR